ncbi:MAG: LPXTG cell wall anchor domain-containing protein [Pseudolactococcus laudensis]
MPDTGESKNTILTAAGIIMLAILGSYLYLKKRQVD